MREKASSHLPVDARSQDLDRFGVDFGHLAEDRAGALGVELDLVALLELARSVELEGVPALLDGGIDRLQILDLHVVGTVEDFSNDIFRIHVYILGG